MIKVTDTAAFTISAARLRAEDGEVRPLLALYGIDFDDVRDWSLNAADAAYGMREDYLGHAGRFTGAVAAAIVLGIELARSGEVGVQVAERREDNGPPEDDDLTSVTLTHAEALALWDDSQDEVDNLGRYWEHRGLASLVERLKDWHKNESW